MKLITKLAIVGILCTLLICGGVSASSQKDCLCIEIDGTLGASQSLDLFGFCITDCDGNRFSLNEINKVFDYSAGKASQKIDLSHSGLNCDKPFKEVKLHLKLMREWGFMWCYGRLDDFTLDVSNLVTKKKDEPYTVLLKADSSYQVGKADAVTIYDCNKNELIHFSPTHDDGCYGSFSPSKDWLYAKYNGGITLFINGVSITDCDGNKFILNEFDATWGNYFNGHFMYFKNIDLTDLKSDEPFKEVKLHLTLCRGWGFMWCYERFDKFTLDVSDLITKKKDEPYTVLLKADYSYQVGKADAVTIYDCNKNELIHFSPTHDDGEYGSWDL